MENESLTKYEVARILGARALQLSMNAPMLLAISKEKLEEINFDPLKIAELEFESNVLPITIKRPLPERLEGEGPEEEEDSELLKEIGLQIKDDNSFLYQATKNNIPVYCPGIADSSFGFQLYMFQQKHPDFIVDTILDMRRITEDLSFDEKKGLVSLGGSISKHYAVFAALLSGGFDYAVYLTTSHSSSGSKSGATTQEAKSWGKIKDDGEAATVNGDVTITFPLIISYVLDNLLKEGLLENE